MGGGNRLARVGRAVAVVLVAGLVVALPAYATAPNNDNFAAAQAITGTSGSITGTNVEATKEAGEPNHAGNAGGKSVWYSWTAPRRARRRSTPPAPTSTRFSASTVGPAFRPWRSS